MLIAISLEAESLDMWLHLCRDRIRVSTISTKSYYNQLLLSQFKE